MNPAADPEPPRRRAWPMLLLAALAAALGSKAYIDHQNPRAAERGAAPVPAAVSASAASAASAMSAVAGAASAPASAPEPQWGQPGEAAARVARAASAALATARAAAGLEPAAPVEQTLALCGVGRLSLPPVAATAGLPTAPPLQAAWVRLPPALAGLAREAAMTRVLATLSAPDRSDRDRAAALVWQAEASAAVWPAMAPASAASAAPVAGPAHTPEADALARAAATRKLARLARSSPDATVMHWALALCGREDKVSAECRRLPMADGPRKAPDDGLAWLTLARRPGVAAAERERALARAAEAPYFGGHAAQLARAFDAAWPAELPAYLLQDVLHTAQRIGAGLSQPAYAAALELCTAETLADGVRRGRCEALARRMAAQGSELEALDVAAVLGARLGWPAAEVEALRLDQARLAVVAAGPVSGSAEADQPYACGAVAVTREGVRSAAAEGELQAARRRLATNPITARPAASRP